MITARRGRIFQYCVQAMLGKYAVKPEELDLLNLSKNVVSGQIRENVFARSRKHFSDVRVVDHQPWTKYQLLKTDELAIETFVTPILPDKMMKSVVKDVLAGSRKRLNPEVGLPDSHIRYHCEPFEDSLKAGISGPTNLLFNCKMTFCEDKNQWITNISAAKVDITGQAPDIQLGPEGLKAFTALRLIRDKMEGLNLLKDWHLQMLVQSADPAENVVSPGQLAGAEQPAGMTVQGILNMLRELEKEDHEDWPFRLTLDDLILLELDEESLKRMKKDANCVFRNPTRFVEGMDAIQWNDLANKIHAA